MIELMNHFRETFHPDPNGDHVLITTPKYLQQMKSKTRMKTMPKSEYDAFIQKGYLYIRLEVKPARGRPRMNDDERAISLNRR